MNRISKLTARILRTLAPKEYLAAEAHRSDSEDGTYLTTVQSAIGNHRKFKTFKRHPLYRLVLEHVSRADGEKYLEIIKLQSPEFLADIEKFKENDLIGSPITHRYPDLGSISPTTLRYMKVASDLATHFGPDLGESIAEIGGGYGGQMLICDKVFKFREYHLFDLPPVLALASKYLECHLLNGSYETCLLNQYAGNANYDLVISNYAFSELPAALQRKYIEKVLSKAKKGYLTMNNASRPDRLSQTDLRSLLPPFEMLAENPMTAPGNYLIVWS